MALWKDTTSQPGTTPAQSFTNPAAAPQPREPEKTNVAPLSPDAARRPVKEAQRLDMKESVIASDLTIEGKIIGSGHVRIAGRFKGDVQVDGNVTLDTGAHLEGLVKAQRRRRRRRAHRQHRERQARRAARRRRHQRRRQGRLLTVAAGSRMRGQVEFGWDERSVAAEVRQGIRHRS